MKVQFVSSFAVITPDPPESRKLFVESLGLPLEPDPSGEYFHGEVEGSKHFGVWPLAHAARSCFGTDEWPADRPVPQASVEFDLESVEAVKEGEAELVAAGFDLLHETKTEPWGQTVCRVQTPEGVVVGISFAPWMH